MPDISYTPTPVGVEFIRSEKKYTFCVGPVGPVSGDTEFFTGSGWKRVDAYQPGDRVAQWAPAADGSQIDGVVSLVEPLDYIVTPAESLIHIKNKRSMSMVVSANHRVPYYTPGGAFVVGRAADVAAAPGKKRIPVSFRVDSCGTGMSEEALRLAVAIHADGYFPSLGKSKTSVADNYCEIVVRKDRKKDRIRALLAAAGVNHREYTYARRPTEVRFVFYSPYIGKSYDTPAWWGATTDELAVVLDEMIHWDGSFEGEAYIFHTNKRKDADFMQYAAHATGGRATISAISRADGSNRKEWYNVIIARRGSPLAPVVLRRGANYSAAEVPAVGGKQYCFSTPSTFFLARHNNRVFITGNSGKTTASLFKILYHAKKQRPNPADGIRYTRFVVVRSTNRQLFDTTLKSFFQWFPPGVAGEWSATQKTFTFRFDDVHCEVLFRPLDNAADVSNVLSLEITGAMVDEFVEIPREIVDAVQSRCGRYPSSMRGGCSWAGMFGVSNPGTQDSWWYNWLYEEWPEEEGGLAAQEAALNFFEQPSGFSKDAENLDNLPPYDGESNEYYTQLAIGKSESWIKQFIEVEWGYSQRGKPVYKAFNRELHVAKQPLKFNPHLPLVIGFDAGLTPAASLMQQDSYGRVLILDELVSENMGAKRFCREKLKPLLNRKYPNASIIVAADPATTQRAQTDEKTVAQVVAQELGVKVKPASSNTLAARLGAVDEFLTRLTEVGPALLIDPACKQTIIGFTAGYKFAINAKGVAADSPEKNNHSHLADSIQYGMMSFVDNTAREARARKHAHHAVHSRNTYVY